MDEIEKLTDVDALWSKLKLAKADDDHALVARIKARMAQLQAATKYSDLSDAELERRIEALLSSGKIDNIKYAGMMEDSVMNNHVRQINLHMIAANEHPAMEHLNGLRQEQRRRSQPTTD